MSLILWVRALRVATYVICWGLNEPPSVCPIRQKDSAKGLVAPQQPDQAAVAGISKQISNWILPLSP